MKKYRVYGMGNALVDIEYEVKPELLQELAIDKGVMTLIDEDRQGGLVQQLSEFECKRGCGGSAANTIIGISQLGGKCFYSCKVANDDTGLFFLQDLLSYGVESNLQGQALDAGVTGKCLVLVTPDADRTMNTFLGITGTFSNQELVPEAIADSDYLYIEGYLVASPDGKAAAIQGREVAQNAGTKVALSLSDLNMAKFFKPGFLEIIGSAGIDFIFANETEALTLAETDDLKAAIAYLKQLSKGFAITLGAKGSLVFDGENLLEIAPVNVDAVDTVGAGDMYAGALLYGITSGMDWERAGNLASQASATLVTNFGARMPTDVVRSLVQTV